MSTSHMRVIVAIAAARLARVDGDEFGRAYWRAEVARLFRARHRRGRG